ncbi:HIT family protein [Williamsia sp. CHRR-6]|uniref:HIT family protein n=1 Tax=Williamsia sp. CHRR-6 TaxID=2835871 RepID=UPI001BD9253B|nr:HIT family protein [Williamsia sp. CHRR-6]MBT0566905.1 HIT family protein [Williamsia sp. CHRR-6]
MASVFSMIINGDLPGRFVWTDDTVVAFLTINPVTPGHVLVVPRAEVDHWEQVDPELFAQVISVAQTVGQATRTAFDAPRMGLLIAGLEVPHLHVHVFPAHSLQTFDLALADKNPDPAALDDAAARIRAALREAGHEAHVAD